jgi:hypothetical protein
MPIILAIQEAAMRRIAVRSQLKQIVCESLSRNIHHKKGLVELKVKALSSNLSTKTKIDIDRIYHPITEDYTFS